MATQWAKYLRTFSEPARPFASEAPAVSGLMTSLSNVERDLFLRPLAALYRHHEGDGDGVPCSIKQISISRLTGPDRIEPIRNLIDAVARCDQDDLGPLPRQPASPEPSERLWENENEAISSVVGYTMEPAFKRLLHSRVFRPTRSSPHLFLRCHVPLAVDGAEDMNIDIAIATNGDGLPNTVGALAECKSGRYLADEVFDAMDDFYHANGRAFARWDGERISFQVVPFPADPTALPYLFYGFRCVLQACGYGAVTDTIMPTVTNGSRYIVANITDNGLRWSLSSGRRQDGSPVHNAENADFGFPPAAPAHFVHLLAAARDKVPSLSSPSPPLSPRGSPRPSPLPQVTAIKMVDSEGREFVRISRA